MNDFSGMISPKLSRPYRYFPRLLIANLSFRLSIRGFCRNFVDIYREFSETTGKIPKLEVDRNEPNSVIYRLNLYEINELNFSPIVAGQTETLNIHLEGTLDEMKDWFIEQNNPNNPGIYYYEINESDRIPLASILDAVEQIHKSQDKIRLSEDVGGKIQDKTMDFFLEQNMIQFDNDESKHTKYFVLNGTMYELSFVGFDPVSKQGVVVLSNSLIIVDDIGVWLLEHGHTS